MRFLQFDDSTPEKMKKRLLATIFLLSSIGAFAQVKVNAVILEHSEQFTMNSATSGTRRVHKVVKVLNEDGMDAADFVVFTDSFMSLASFSGEVVPEGGKRIKVSKKDLQMMSLSSGLASDSYLTGYSPDKKFPFVVTYDYTVNYRDGILDFPVFHPLLEEKTVLEQASFKLEVPAGTKVLYHAEALSMQKEEAVKGKDIYVWSCGRIGPFVYEHMMAPLTGVLPELYSMPEDFVYGGVKGCQANWNEYGRWLYSLQTGTDDLSREDRQSVARLTVGCGTTFEKVQALYAFLRSKTRYTSIQLGIGGYKPMNASQVAKTGFGDCKALSNYMQALLREAGVASEYFVLGTDTCDLLPELPAAGQLNHAMLAVPLPENGDTLFVECTNPSIPLGFRHDDVAGHEVILIGPEGGRKVRVGSYPDSLDKTVSRAEVKLSRDGSAAIRASETHVLDDAVSYVSFSELKPDTRKRILTGGWSLHPENVQLVSIDINEDGYAKDGRGYCPRADLVFTMECGKYASQSGRRMFVPLNPMRKGLDFQRNERINPMLRRASFEIVDIYEISIPEGCRVESLPEDIELDSVWGCFVSQVREENGKVEVRQSFTAKPFAEPKERYGEYRDFARKVNKAYTAEFVLSTE